MNAPVRDNRPLSEQLYEAGNDYADKHAAAQFREEMKTAWIAQRATKIEGSVAAAERQVKASDEYRDYIKEMVSTRQAANRAKAKLEALRARVSEQISLEANHRLVSRT